MIRFIGHSFRNRTAHSNILILFAFLASWFTAPYAPAATDGSISGEVTDVDGIALGGARVRVLDGADHVVLETRANATGGYTVFPLTFGDYTIEISSDGYSPFRTGIHVSSGAATHRDAELTKGKEITLKVEARKNLVNDGAATSSREVTQKEIQSLPQGDNIKLPKLLATTNPGIIQGPFGQLFIRGNHANIQYQIDGVQLPDSPSNTFGQAFSPRNIDHMEVITGGVPAEYGERLSAVVNIVSKTGTEAPGGEVEMNYGTYNTFTPKGFFSGSDAAGDFHYYLSAGYNRTDRGLDTPLPLAESKTDPVHDRSHGNDEFVKLDWQADNADKFSLIAFNAYSFYEIPNFPGNYSPSDPIFTAPDRYGNDALNYVPATTNDTQAERNTYVEAVWKHSFESHAFLQVAPYYKLSKLNVANDPTNDLFAADRGLSDGSSFSENRHVHNYGLKTDYANRLDDRNYFKAGFQAQASHAIGDVNVISEEAGNSPVLSRDTSSTLGYFEGIYAQDDFSIEKPLTLNVGLRFDATQFDYARGQSANDSALQPRVGLNYLVTEFTKVHAFYGKLFQPAPAENLRDTFVTVGGGNSLVPYDIKAEKDDYYEVGVSQQVGSHVVGVNTYYKNARNMLDDAQLLNTSIAQPYNFAKGYAYGVEATLQGRIAEKWSDYANYSFERAKGRGTSGGLFTLPPGTVDSGGYQYLDHVQIHTVNAGLVFTSGGFTWTTQGLFGSGLRTGDANRQSLPSHFTADTGVGYTFRAEDGLAAKFRLTGDILNVLNNEYPITIANGYNGSHYAAGRQYFVRLARSF